MKLPSDILFILILTLISFSSNAQQGNFRAGLTAGLNFSELEGEGIVDYFGLNAGIWSSTNLTDKTKFSAELLFSQNGEYILPEFYPDLNYGKVILNHLEIPFYLSWDLNIQKEKEIKSLTLSMGSAYALLINHYAQNSQGEDISSLIIYDEKSAFLVQAGIRLNLSKRAGIDLRYSKSLHSSVLDETLAARFMYRI